MSESVTAFRQTLGGDELASGNRPGRRILGGPAWVVVLLVVLGLTAATVALLSRVRVTAPPVAPLSPAVPPPSLAVVVAPAEYRTMARFVVGDGSVVAWQELAIDVEVGGLRVVEIAADEGDQVRRGQVLARFDDTVLAAQAAQYAGALAEAEAALAIARSDFSRGTELSRGGFIAAQTVDQRQSIARQADARVVSARARHEEAVARLAQAQLLAPADGVVIRRSVQPGAVSSQGQEMFRIVRDGRLEFDAKVPELELAAVHPGQEVNVVHGDTKVRATVRAVAPVVAADTRLGLVHIALPTDSGLRPGMFARAEISADSAPMLALPQEAIVFRGDTPSAFVVANGDRVSLRRLTTGMRRDGYVEILSGLEAGESVVVSGAGFLSNDDRVRVVSPLVAAAN